MAEQPPYAPNVVNQTVSYGGATWKGNPGTGWSLEAPAASNVGFNMDDVIKGAKELNTWQVEQNKPVIASIEAQRKPLTDRYQALLDQIRGNQATSEKRQEITTSSELGRRGISSQSGLFGQTVTDALNPITEKFTNLYKETAAGRESDLLSLAQQVAQLQAGSPSNAISQALQFGNYQQQAQQAAASIAAQQAQQQMAQQQMALAQKEYGLKEKQYMNDPYGLFR